jgi:hypothetical protein
MVDIILHSLRRKTVKLKIMINPGAIQIKELKKKIITMTLIIKYRIT